MEMNKNADYGNWVPAAMMKLLWCLTVVAVVATVLMFVLFSNRVPGIIMIVVTLWSLCMTLYMQRCRYLFDFNGGGLMGEFHQFLIDNFPWNESRKQAGVSDGSGSILDIGCGAAALTNRVAKTFPNASLTGMDFWGAEWSYAKEQCERNAKIEGIANRVFFQKGDAANLDFKDGAFDGVVSNFVFHEVHSAANKREVVKEALRVLKKGGAFAFQDMFGQKAVYGNMHEFVDELKNSGVVSEIHYIPNIENQKFVPKFITAPWMIKNAGLVYGIK